MDEVTNLTASAQENTESNAENSQEQNMEGIAPGGDNSQEQEKIPAPGEENEKPDDEDIKKDLPEGAPEEYEKFNLPEELAYDEKLAAEWGNLAKEQNLTQEQAQKYVDYYAELQKRSIAEIQKNQQEFSDQLKQETLKDPEIGGVNWTETSRNVARARDTFGNERFTQLIQDNPALGNHPGFLYFLNQVGKAIAEDQMPSGRSAATSKSAAEVLYPQAELKK